MSNRTENINIRLAATDATQAGIESTKRGLEGLFAKARELNMETRKSGEMAFERILKGGGIAGLATFGAEAITQGVKSVTEVLEKMHAGELTAAQGTVEMTGGFIKAIPVLGRFLEVGEAIGGLIREQLAPGYAALADAQERATRAAREATIELRKAEGDESSRRQEDVKERAGKKLTEIAEQEKEARGKLITLRAEAKAAESEVGSEYRTDDGHTERDDQIKAYETTLKTLGEARKKTEEATEAELREVRSQAADRRLAEARKSENDIRSLETEAMAASLREVGQNAQAEMARITADNERRRQEILDHYEKAFQDAKNDDARYHELHEDRKKELDALGQSTAASLARAGREREREQAASQNRIRNAEEDGAAAGLRAQRNEHEAALAELKRHHNDVLAEISRQRSSESEKQQLRAAENRKYAADQAILDKQQQDLKEDRQREIDQTLVHSRIDLLRQVGELGDADAKRAAEQLALAQRYNDEKEKLNKILREGKDLTDQQRGQIQSALSNINQEEKAAQLALLYRSVGSYNQNLFANAPDTAHSLSGVQDVFRSAHSSDGEKRLAMYRDAAKSREVLEGVFTLIKHPDQWLLQVINRLTGGGGQALSNLIAGQV